MSSIINAIGTGEPAIELRGVTKRYGRRPAVEQLDLTVERGEALGFLGPNGAGKTTTIRLLTGFLRPSAGTVRLLGHDMSDRRSANLARQQLGFVPDVSGLDPAESGAQLLDDLGRLQGQPPVDREDLCAALELRAADLARPMGSLSRGTRQKINLVQGLQHRPALLILDEPTEGLDPLGKRALFDVLRAAKRGGATIFFSSHVVSEVEELCDRVALIRSGRLVAVDRLDALRQQLHRRVTLKIADDATGDFQLRLAALPGITGLSFEQGRCRFDVVELGPVLRLLATLPIEDLVIEPPALSEIVLRYYREQTASSE